MVIPTYFQLRTTVNLMSQQSTQSQPTQAVYFFLFCFYFAYYLFFHHIKGMPKTSWKYSLNAENICIFNVSM